MAYNYLPGFDVSIRDGGLVVPRQEFQTGSLLIIGPQATANTGTQSVTPKWISNQEVFETTFGTVTDDNPLFQAWKQAVDAGCKDVRLLELCGEDADDYYANLHTIYTHLEDYIVDAVVLIGVYGDDTVTAPTLTGAEYDYPTFVTGILQTATNESIGTGDGTKVAFTATHAPIVPGTVTVKVATATITDFTVDTVTGTITLGDPPANAEAVTASYKYAARGILSQLAGFCKVVSNRVSQTLGFVALKAASAIDLATLKTYISSQTTQLFDGLVSVVAGPKARFALTDGTTYLDSGIAAYAAQVVMLPPQSAPTNKPLAGCSSLEYNLSPAQLDELCGKNIVTFRTKAGRVVVTDGVTTAGRTSDFTRLSTVRIVNEAVQAIREVADPFIGEPNDLPQQNALNTAIKSALDAMVKAGALRAFSFSLNATLQDYIDGKMKVDVVLVPAFELRKITTTVALKPSL